MMDVDGMIKILEGFKLIPVHTRTVVMTDLWIDVQVAALRAAEALSEYRQSSKTGINFVTLGVEWNKVLQAEAEYAALRQGEVSRDWKKI